MVSAQDRSKKPEHIHQMFSEIPETYDPLNRIMSWGMDKRWRERAARVCLETQPRRILDLCCGTGDLTVHLARRAPAQADLVAADFCRPMLDLAIPKVARRASRQTVTFVLADAASLPFPDGHFDCVATGFALRNLTYKNPRTPQFLAEIIRILRPGGRWVVVETSQPRGRLMRAAYRRYLRWGVPLIGGLLARRPGAYRYLGESTARFYDPDQASAMLRDAGFSRVTYRRLFFGAAAIHIAEK